LETGKKKFSTSKPKLCGRNNPSISIGKSQQQVCRQQQQELLSIGKSQQQVCRQQQELLSIGKSQQQVCRQQQGAAFYWQEPAAHI
jgi:hypothetical protein